MKVEGANVAGRCGVFPAGWVAEKKTAKPFSL